ERIALDRVDENRAVHSVIDEQRVNEAPPSVLRRDKDEGEATIDRRQRQGRQKRAEERVQHKALAAYRDLEGEGVRPTGGKRLCSRPRPIDQPLRRSDHAAPGLLADATIARKDVRDGGDRDASSLRYLEDCRASLLLAGQQ